ncbi:MAG: hypothetical protein HKN18_10640 [Silicimonas sp.]|nr:hypothetical protein [Silicimonas sp.]
MISFIQNKKPDFAEIEAVLAPCAAANHWANRGPVYYETAEVFADHLGIPEGSQIVPCANGGVALEIQARLLEHQKGQKLRWVASAFSFHNIGRGYFSDVGFVDIDDQGMLDLAEIERLDPAEFDGIIVVNPFGMADDFARYTDLAKRLDKHLLIDNAAGVGPGIPDWPWQSFSLHHTKPYGFGEGGLALVPTEFVEPFYSLIDYGDQPEPASLWFNNGKVSDLSCAMHLAWLNRVDHWAPMYVAQSQRVDTIARDMGLWPLHPVHPRRLTMSRAYRCGRDVDISVVRSTQNVKCGKYYKPLCELPSTLALYSELVNIPSHPDMAQLSDEQLRDDIRRLLGTAR